MKFSPIFSNDAWHLCMRSSLGAWIALSEYPTHEIAVMEAQRRNQQFEEAQEAAAKCATLPPPTEPGRAGVRYFEPDTFA